MAVITDPNLLKTLKKVSEERLQKMYNKIVTTDYPTGNSFRDLTGMDFGYIHVDSYCGRSLKGDIYYKCTCNYCGFPTIMEGGCIRNPVNYTCGCFKYKHDYAYEKLYHEYQNIYDRCYNPNNRSYPKYGGRGIKMADIWLGPDGYKNFRKWAYENGYTEAHENGTSKEYISLDRIDNDGNYSPENCRWADVKLQSNNRSSCVFLLWNNYVFTVAIWVEISGISRSTLLHRLERGWSINESLRTPTHSIRGHDLFNLVIDSKYDKYNKYEEFKAKGILNTCTYP